MRLQGGTLLSDSLTPAGGNTYAASFPVTALSARTGPAGIGVTGTDLAGNTFIGAPAGPELVFDLTKPTGVVTTNLPSPIKTTAAVDLTISKRFTLLTPYAGAGMVRVKSSAAGSGLAGERFDRSRYFGGLNMNLVALNVAFEAEKMGENLSLSAKVGWRF